MNIMILFDINKDEIERFKKDINKLASRERLGNDVTISILLRDVKSFDNRKDIIAFHHNVNREGNIIYGGR